MCGIVGIISENSTKHESRVKKMMDSLVHRGPDGEGYTNTFRKCILGHRRLSVVDLSTGDQPMYNKTGDVAVVFNGEIYGYKDITKNLETFPFQTNSDTEVILALYEKYDIDFSKQLPGMFSLAIWDERKNILVATRDRFGEKPFYYAFGKHGEFIFASEIKAIIASELIDPKIDQNALAHYLKKLYVHPKQTIYKNIFTLPPAHQLIYKDGKIDVYNYWSLPDIQNSITTEEALPEFKRLLTEAVQKQLIADVPVGTFLSGGLDSTTIVSIASQFNPKIKTFSFGFEGSKNELGFAKKAAEQYGTDHHEIHENEYDVAELALKMAEIYDEPFADSSNIPTYLISKRVREHAKVVLSGDAGDELFGGYGWYKTILNINKATGSVREKKLLDKQFFMRIIAQIAMRQNWKNKMRIITNARSLYYENKYDSVIDAHQASNVYFKDNDIAELNVGGVASAFSPSFPLLNDVSDAMRNDIEDYLPGDILVKTDRASMANSLELRVPFLDVFFAEFAISLPSRLKVNSTEDKIILRRAYEESWPETIRKRNKQGFGGPMTLWLKKPAVQELIHQYLDDPQKKIFQYISFPASRKYISNPQYKTWILLTLSIWMEKHKL